jgi:biotin operon repressor
LVVDQDKRAEYVERWALLLEDQGQPRIAGRLYAHLATADTPYLSQEELADQLGVSRASVSTNIRRLIDFGMVTRVAVPGSRLAHYALDPGSPRHGLLRVAEMSRRLAALAQEGLELQPDVVTPGTQSLRYLVEGNERLASSVEQIVEQIADGPASRTRSAKRMAT